MPNTPDTSEQDEQVVWKHEELIRHGCRVWVLYINNQVVGSLSFDDEELYNQWLARTKDIPRLT